VQARWRIVLIAPLVVLALGHLTLLLGQSYCNEAAKNAIFRQKM
jgi:hypothetical protein